MRKRTLLIVITIIGLAGLFVTTGIIAGTEVPAVITMKNKAYKKHKKPIVEFQHQKHLDDYSKKHPTFYKNGCGKCHHDKDNKPLKNLKAGDAVQSCIECHKKPGEIPLAEKKAMRKDKLSKKEKKKRGLVYHAETLHYNCRDCHKLYNKKNKLKSKDKGYAPATCIKCHRKKK